MLPPTNGKHAGGPNPDHGQRNDTQCGRGNARGDRGPARQSAAFAALFHNVGATFGLFPHEFSGSTEVARLREASTFPPVDRTLKTRLLSDLSGELLMTDAAPAGGASSTQIAPGTLVGGRFLVKHVVAEDAFGRLLRAEDKKTGKGIALRVFPGGFLTPDATKALRAECRIAARLAHRSLAATYGVGASGQPFVATEWVDGQPLSQLIAKRAAKGGQMSLRGAYNVVAHVCRALSTVHEKTCHGSLRPEVVWVTKSGRVKLTELGVGKALLETRGIGAYEPADQASLAPEVKTGSAPTTASDIFGIGAILYQLLTGKSPAEGFIPPSQAHPDATEAIDRILLKCLAADPNARYASPDDVRSALQPLVADAPASDAAVDFEIDVALDLDEPAVAAPPAAPKPPAPKAPPPPPGAKPQVGQRVSIGEEFRPSMASAPPVTAAAEVDLSKMLAKITENDAPRWMVVKDGLDHGPFSGRELVKLIVEGEILEHHDLSNMDTGERRPIKEWPEFSNFVEQQKLRREEKERVMALQAADRSEARSGMVKIGVAAVALLAVVGGITAFLLTRESGGEEEIAEADLGDFIERGQIELTGTAGILPDPPRRGMRGMMGGSGRTVMAGSFVGSYEEAMNVAVELGDATMGGGQGRLSPGDVQGVMNRNLNRIFNRCVVPEMRRGGRIGNVTVDIAIAGNGRVMGVSARQGSGAFKGCVRGAVRGIRFPTFGAPRMGARYSFSAE